MIEPLQSIVGFLLMSLLVAMTVVGTLFMLFVVFALPIGMLLVLGGEGYLGKYVKGIVDAVVPDWDWSWNLDRVRAWRWIGTYRENRFKRQLDRLTEDDRLLATFEGQRDILGPREKDNDGS